MFYRPIDQTSSPEEILEAFERYPPYSLPKNCHGWENTKSALRLLIHKAIAKLNVEPVLSYEGRGIVTCGGGAKYLPSIYVLVRRLRALGCTLPIEIWHLGQKEIDPAMRRVLRSYNVSFVDAEALARAYRFRILNGWELKLYAMIHSNLAEILFLDADSVPTRDPSFLFEDEEFRETGAFFWPDYTTWTLDPWVWSTFGLPSPPDELGGKAIVPRHRVSETYGIRMADGYDPPIESGQLLVDKKRCWAALRLAGLLCEMSDVTFQYVHGDKEMFRFAWKHCGQSYALPKYLPSFDTHTILQFGPGEQANVLFAHRTLDKLRVGAKGNRRGESIPTEEEFFTLAIELEGLWAGSPWQNERPSPIEQDLGRTLEGSIFRYRLSNGDERLIGLGAESKITIGAERLERRWSLFVDEGVPTLAIHGDESLTATATVHDDGVWRGRWLVHEKTPFELIATEKKFHGR